MDVDSLEQLKTESLQRIQQCADLTELQSVKTQFLGPKSTLIEQVKTLKSLTGSEKSERGKQLNAIKNALEDALAEKTYALHKQERLKRLGTPVDPTLPSPYPTAKPLHPLTQVRLHILSIFKRLGYAVQEGNEIETEWYCFDALNAAPDHPSRSEQDTFFLNNFCCDTTSKKGNEPFLLRTQTSTVQIRTLLKHQPPLKIISPGRVFRRDTDDAKHRFNFHQIEGLCVDKTTSVADLRGTLDYFIKEFFGTHFKTRLRPSFFPFTEPSFEVDIFAENLGKFHNTWIEVLGCGMVNPNVLTNCGLSADEWQGFAFGIGIERLAMLRLGIDDIRALYQNDERFLSQF